MSVTNDGLFTNYGCYIPTTSVQCHLWPSRTGTHHVIGRLSFTALLQPDNGMQSDLVITQNYCNFEFSAFLSENSPMCSYGQLGARTRPEETTREFRVYISRKEGRQLGNSVLNTQQPKARLTCDIHETYTRQPPAHCRSSQRHV